MCGEGPNRVDSGLYSLGRVRSGHSGMRDWSILYCGTRVVGASANRIRADWNLTRIKSVRIRLLRVGYDSTISGRSERVILTAGAEFWK